MRPLHTLLLLLTLAACGLVSWLLFSGADGPGGIAPPLQEQPFVRAQSSEPAEPADLTSPLADVPEVPMQRTGLPSEEPKEVAAEVSKSRMISGTLTDAVGNVLKGARVLVAPRTGMGAMGLDLAAPGSLPWISREEGETDDAGRFELACPPGAGVRIAARMSGFAPFDGEFSVKQSESHDIGSVALETSVVMLGQVVDVNGVGIAEAELRALPIEQEGVFFVGAASSAGRLLTTTDAEGSFRIDELGCGPYKISVSAKAHPESIQSGITKRPGEQIHGLRWQLEDGLTIQGRVTGAPADRFNTTWVRAMPLVSSTARQRTCEVREDGSFLLEGLLEGVEYRVSAREGERRFWAPARSDSVSAHAGERDLQLPWRLESALVFRVVDSQTGAAIERCTVRAGIDWPGPLVGENGEPVEVHPEGRVRFGGIQAKQAGSIAMLEIDAIGYEHFERKDIALKAGQELELGTLRLTRVPLVRVRVLDDLTGEPIARARVTLREQTKNTGAGMGFSSLELEEFDALTTANSRSQTERTDKEGLATFSSLPGATCNLVAKRKGFADARLSTVVLSATNDHELEIRMRVGGTVLVTVTDELGVAVPRVRIEHRGPEESAGSGQAMFIGPGGMSTDAEGKKEFEHLVPGLHRFRIGKAGGGGMIVSNDGNTSISMSFTAPDSEPEEVTSDWREVEVVERETAELTLIAPAKGALVGKVLESGKPLSGAKVRLEDPEGSGFDGGPFGFGGSPSARTNGEGVFRIEDVDEGDYAVVVTHPSRVMPTEFEAELAEGENDIGTLELFVCIVEGRVTNQDGEPLAGIRVQPKRVAGDESMTEVNIQSVLMIGDDDGSGVQLTTGPPAGEVTVTDSDGRYRLRGVEWNRELRIEAKGEDLQPGRSKTLVLNPDEVRTNVDFVMLQGGKLTVIATRADGSPVGYCLVDAEHTQGDGELAEPKHDVLSEGDRTTLTGLAPGTWSVTLSPLDISPNPSGMPEATEAREAVVVAGQTAEVTIELP